MDIELIDHSFSYLAPTLQLVTEAGACTFLQKSILAMTTRERSSFFNYASHTRCSVLTQCLSHSRELETTKRNYATPLVVSYDYEQLTYQFVRFILWLSCSVLCSFKEPSID
ncbi:hypothetical protein CY34DRAFT_490093 [Suillus luteus UH-Slu-Lm8-n1]|uniref:Uncharacterized protein n=1 Tax=Suillus luteus UH-Slu-Lm8-n1 TaxID=930992 RepID=A0A0D0ARH5_9AGAM|nr:hypothetical protein CY34DRAFT_490093 [Suillus luteus UH-Slu-Lm8-n1]